MDIVFGTKDLEAQELEKVLATKRVHKIAYAKGMEEGGKRGIHLKVERLQD